MGAHYKIAIIGLGSIGRRHLFNIVKVLDARDISYSIDLIRRDFNNEITEDIKSIINDVYTDYFNVPDDYDVIFITNPTFLHFDTVKSYIPKTKHMFIEKPVFSDPAVAIQELMLNENGIYYIACPLRYTDVIQYVKHEINLSKVYSVRAICSSYLPQWRAGVDYRDTYSAHADEGGGVSIDLIHEWDYLVYLFGHPDRVENFRGKVSHLEIDSDDLSIYIAKYRNMMAEVHLDYFGIQTIRELQLFTDEDTIIADIANSRITYLKRNEMISFAESRNDYQLKEISSFFDVIEGKLSNPNDIAAAIMTLKIAKEGSL
ncbi:oxidoreductase [Paenibacillus sp. PK3_47]|uniref:Gfo/Idh/MocA family protein n=1 Tax=Paenibacillus sp. PK3_47 TaxID=2072642 RepID=UPI00201D3987|nr:Gfo/Idh/MocA family oxidoreductase [Paenibacillus sp. PK3_47]UQZ33844.1 oxidoreductase [Paenibacillus sp. PK3_47]